MDGIVNQGVEPFFKILFYQNPQPMWFFDTVTLRFLEVNDAATKHYGYSREAFLSMTVRDIRPEEDLERFEEVRRALNGANTMQRPFRHIKGDGAIIHVQLISYPVAYEGYNARLVMVHDVTEQELLIERFNLISKATHDAIWDWNLESDEVLWSKSFMQMFGYTASDIESSSKFWSARIHPDDRDRVMSSIYEVINTQEKNWTGQYRFLRADGTYAYILDRGYTLFKDGKALRMVGSMMDTSEQVALLQARLDTEARLHTLTSASPTALWMSDLDGAIIYANQKWKDWCDVQGNEDLRGQWSRIIHPDDLEMVVDRFTKAHINRAEYNVDYRIMLKDGSLHWLTSTGLPRYQEDEFLGFVGSCTDITRQKYLELQKDEFISTVSHELKTPITSIKAYEQLISRLKTVDDPKAVSFLGRMRLQISRLDALVQDLLDISRIESGKLTFNATELEMDVLLADLVSDLQLVFTSHRLVITENQPCKINADRNRTIQLITNLIDNAVKYSPLGNEIFINLVCDEAYLTFSIQDFGRGIPREQQPYIFDRFYQVNDVYKAPGLGIGLYLCKEIVKHLDGKIWFESDPGEGTTFYFKLLRNI
ncbi:PAS domain-containing protein [Mucilaginibacter sp. PAMB04274]|uniref:PAS domain-containing sensor histidine kinase n=1 Tax=Mucilaginibacter sp. PAMB04274 TaxID=3138568 RepID=UPI0031F67775